MLNRYVRMARNRAKKLREGQKLSYKALATNLSDLAQEIERLERIAAPHERALFGEQRELLELRAYKQGVLHMLDVYKSLPTPVAGQCRQSTSR